jgi:hypothetical protein
MSESFKQRRSTLLIGEPHSAVDRTVRFLLRRTGYTAAMPECSLRTLRELDDPMPHIMVSDWALPAISASQAVEMLLDWHAQDRPKPHRMTRQYQMQ